MVAFKNNGLALAFLSAVSANIVPDCTHILEVAPTPALGGVKTVWAASEQVVKLVDCAGCNSLYTLEADYAKVDATHTVLAEGTRTNVIYQCAKTPGTDDIELRRDVADVSTVSSTITRTAYGSSTMAVGIFNCTVPVYRNAPAAAATSAAATSAAATSVAAREVLDEAAPALQPRQTSVVSSSTPTATATATATVDSTTTVYAYTTVTASAVTLTNYQCAVTMDYIISIVSTSTILYNVTTYTSTATPLSTVVCPGVGGYPVDYIPPMPTAMLPSSASAATTPAAALETAAANRILDADLIDVVPEDAEALTTVLTSTLNQTSTVFSAVTVTHPGVLTRVNYQCSSLAFDVTSSFPLLLTAYSTTATATRYMRCRATPSTPAALAARTLDAMPLLDAVNERRQVSSTAAASNTLHRTTYIGVPTTTTLDAATTKIAYVCYTAPAITRGRTPVTRTPPA